MKGLSNEKGSVIVFVTLMIVVLLIMVGMGLDTGQLTYVRSQGQAAVDAAALAAVSGLPEGNAQVTNRGAGFNSTNDYVESPTNPIGSTNISYVKYDFATNAIADYLPGSAGANGVRVALEQSTGSGITTPVFLTPLMNLLGVGAPATADINVSAVAVISSKPSIPIAIWESICDGKNKTPPQRIRQQTPARENSCWTTYLDKSSGANDIRALFTASQTCSGVPMGEIDVGVPIYENKGQVASTYGPAYDLFIDKYPGRCWLVPVIANSTKNCNESNPTPIRDWAEICPTEVSKQGAHSYIDATVQCGRTLGETLAGLCFSHRLVRETKSGM